METIKITNRNKYIISKLQDCNIEIIVKYGLISYSKVFAWIITNEVNNNPKETKDIIFKKMALELCITYNRVKQLYYTTNFN